MNNKYVYTSVAFVLWLLLFDRNNIISQVELTREKNALAAEKQHYLSEIAKDRAAMEELQSSLGNLEKFGREKYLMKRENEDVFVVVKEKE